MAKLTYNENDVKRTAVLCATIGNAATTWGSGIIIPAGALVTGVNVCALSAITTTNASATVVLNAGTVPLIATTKINALPAQTVSAALALLTTSGMYLSVGGELNLVVSASSNTACTAAYNFYVDYLFVG